MMVRFHGALCFLVALTTLDSAARGQAPPPPAQESARRVYGEWRIRIKPDKGPEYEKLIEQSGLPLFREAGGRMVGWWKTLIGDLYEHVTIWEYDDMAAFAKRPSDTPIQKQTVRQVRRGPRPRSWPVRKTGSSGSSPEPSLSKLPEPAPFQSSTEIPSHVPLASRAFYLEFMTQQGLKLLKDHGFRPAGPWVVDVGSWTEVSLPVPVPKHHRAGTAHRRILQNARRRAAYGFRWDRRIRPSPPRSQPASSSPPPSPPRPQPPATPLPKPLRSIPHSRTANRSRPESSRPASPTNIATPTAAGSRSATKPCSSTSRAGFPSPNSWRS